MIYTTKIIDFIREELNNDSSLFVETPFYQNNPSLKKGNLLFDLSAEEFDELDRVKEDIIYFGNKYAKVITPNGLSNISLYGYQEDYLKIMTQNRFVIGMLARQTGKTLLEAIYCVYSILNGKNVLICSNLRATSIEILEKVKTIYSGLPFFMKPGIQIWNQASISFDNGCEVRTMSREKQTIKKYDVIFVDEAAHIPKFEDMYKDIQAALNINGQMIIQSTPNGKNKFYELWDSTVNGKSSFMPFSATCWVVPGRDDAWKAKMIENLGGSEDAFMQEYELSFETTFSISTKEQKEKIDKNVEEVESLRRRLDAVEKILGLVGDKGEPHFDRNFVLKNFLGTVPDNMSKGEGV